MIIPMKTLLDPLALPAADFFLANPMNGAIGVYPDHPFLPTNYRYVGFAERRGILKQSGRRYGSFGRRPKDREEAAVAEIFRTLARCTRKIPVLVGDRVESQAKVIRSLRGRLESNDVPRCFSGKRLRILDWTRLQEEALRREEFEWRVNYALGGNRHDLERTVFLIPGLPAMLRIEGEEVPLASLLCPHFYRRDLQLVGTSSRSGFESRLVRRRDLYRRCWPIAV